MNAMQEELFLELRQTQIEIENSLKNKQKPDWLTSILKEELADIDAALLKIKKGNFGQCEISGEFLPDDLLKIIPTIKSIKDSDDLEIYYKKSLH
jgi:RNA polymerase-binding transcription factor DksA